METKAESTQPIVTETNPTKKKTRHFGRIILVLSSSVLTVLTLSGFFYSVWLNRDWLFKKDTSIPNSPTPTIDTTPQTNVTIQRVTSVNYANLSAILELEYPTSLGIIAKAEKVGQTEKLTLEYKGIQFSLSTFPADYQWDYKQNFKTTAYKELWSENFRVQEKSDKDYVYYFYGMRSYYPSECASNGKYCFVRQTFLNTAYQVELKVPVAEATEENLKFFDDLLLNAAQWENATISFKGMSPEHLDDYFLSNDSNEYYYFMRRQDYNSENFKGTPPEMIGMYDSVYLINPNVLSVEQKALLTTGNLNKDFRIEAKCNYVLEGMPGIEKCYQIRSLQAI